MHKLIEHYFEKKLSPEEKKYLFQKIETDEEWKKEFITIQNLRGLIVWASQTGSHHKVSAENKQSTGRHATFHFIGYAAAILIAFTCSWFIKDQLYPPNEDKPLLSEKVIYQEVSTPAGQRAFVRLPDSTTIWLNARTKLRYPVSFTEEERRIELEGEAFFDVKKDINHPFVVSTENYDVRVTGTSFNVYAYKGRNEFSTSLTEGSVHIVDRQNESHSIQLNPNERVEFINGRLAKTDFYNMDFLLWKDGIYAFDDLSFSDIIKKLELYYDVSIVVNNNNIKNFKFSGKFRQRDGVERVLQTLQKIHPFSFVKDDELNIITIK